MVQKSDAIILLQQAEQIDQYLSECDDDWVNFLARKHNMYAPNTISTTDTVDYYNSLFKRLSYYLPKQLHNVGDIKIVVLMPTADGGMPHTRPPNIICYPGQRGVTHGTVNSIINESPITFVHEVCHVHQRKFSKMWTKLFAEMGWIEWNDNGTFKEKHDEPTIGRSCILDPHRFSFTWLTTSVTEIVEQREDYIKFNTRNSVYELFITIPNEQ